MNVQFGLFSQAASLLTALISRAAGTSGASDLPSVDRFVAPAAGAGSSLIPAWDTAGAVASLAARSFDPERIARTFNGTAHTAGLRDMRLARKVVDVMRTENGVRRNPSEAIEARRRLHAVLKGYDFFESGRDFDNAALLSLLQAINSPEIQALVQDLQSPSLLLEVVPDGAIDDVVTRWGKASCLPVSFFEARRHRGLPDRILIRAFPAVRISREETAREILERLFGAMHEWEHSRHFWLGKHGHAASETMSLLEEYRLRLRIFDFDIPRAAAREGITSATLLARTIRHA